MSTQPTSILESYLEDLASLVNFDCGTENPDGVTRAAGIMKEHFDSIGFKTEIIDFGPAVGNGLLATNKPGASRYDVLLNAHLDTVFPDGTAATRPLTIKGDRAYGPGCADCKGGVLAIYYALKAARKEDLDRLSIAVAYNPDEETGSRHSQKWLSELSSKADRVLIFEPARANGELVRSRKGAARLKINFHGQSSHAGNAPYKGANANLAAIRFASAAAGLADVERGTTVNPGLIHGGEAANIISSHCEVVLDLRYWNNVDWKLLTTEIEKLAQQTWAPRVTQEYVWLTNDPAMPYSESSKVLVDQVTEAARLEGFEVKWLDVGGASDGNLMAEHGTLVVDGCGPAGGDYHSDKEFLRLDTVEERIRMVSRFLTLI
ncbi:MAG: M20 family metallopeptidase [Burkholderiaceae bacterium]|nr:M20 family metallopeptidase [Burkholderiaceae bacterium]